LGMTNGTMPVGRCLSTNVLSRIQSEFLRQVTDGLVVVLLLRMGYSPFVVGFRVLRLKPDGFGQVRDGLGVLAFSIVGQSSVVVDVGMRGVDTDGFIQVHQC